MENVESIIKLLHATKPEVPKGKRYSLHTLVYFNLGWIICVLVLILAAVIATKVTDLKSDRLVSALSNFSMILSIILSISSILFAYFTSRDTNNQYIAMGKAIEEIRAVSLHSYINNSDLFLQVESIARDVGGLNSKYDWESKLSKYSDGAYLSKIQTSSDVSNVSNVTAGSENPSSNGGDVIPSKTAT